MVHITMLQIQHQMNFDKRHKDVLISFIGVTVYWMALIVLSLGRASA